MPVIDPAFAFANWWNAEGMQIPDGFCNPAMQAALKLLAESAFKAGLAHATSLVLNTPFNPTVITFSSGVTVGVALDLDGEPFLTVGKVEM